MTPSANDVMLLLPTTRQLAWPLALKDPKRSRAGRRERRYNQRHVSAQPVRPAAPRRRGFQEATLP